LRSERLRQSPDAAASRKRSGEWPENTRRNARRVDADWISVLSRRREPGIEPRYLRPEFGHPILRMIR
jgi:hypothetical protein